MRQLDAVVATCADEVTELLGQGADPRRLHVVPCGVDLTTFTPSGPRQVPWSPGTGRLLVLGRLVERKGVDTAIAALADIPGAELVIAGGPALSRLDDDPDVARLRAVAAAAGVAGRVRFVGRVGPAEAAALMRAADLVLAAPWYEPFGIVPLEAMACGTPVVASAVGGMLDTVEHGVTGVQVRPRDPVGLATAVRRLLANPAERSVLGRTAARRVAERYSWQQVADDTEAVYAQLLGAGHPALAQASGPASAPARHEEAR
jgi:glycosyltransferase involved in cell wall biosynthesis